MKTSKTSRSVLIFCVLVAPLCLAADSSFRVRVPDLKGKQSKAVLSFDDQAKTIEVRPVKRDAVEIPYGSIDKCSYEYTNEGTMISDSKVHWLDIEYHEKDTHKTMVVRMTKHDAIRILDALKAHTGIDAEILGNADKRHGTGWHAH
ncbi:MAG TPA: hypothetical protein VKV39_03730 [Candidatus Sulfotelmatobacter sp.]|nr:hypothetical protein [Candidatus Sulfotelmatobacter sp.]